MHRIDNAVHVYMDKTFNFPATIYPIILGTLDIGIRGSYDKGILGLRDLPLFDGLTCMDFHVSWFFKCLFNNPPKINISSLRMTIWTISFIQIFVLFSVFPGRQRQLPLSHNREIQGDAGKDSFWRTFIHRKILS